MGKSVLPIVRRYVMEISANRYYYRSLPIDIIKWNFIYLCSNLRVRQLRPYTFVFTHSLHGLQYYGLKR